MFRRVLEISWESSRVALFPLTVASFGLPLASVQGFGASPEANNLAALDPWLPLYPLLALAVGFSLALSVWNWDHQAEHIYSLTLPISRAGWAVEKMSTGVVLLMIPFFAFMLGAYLATATLTIPAGLHAYPMDLSLRFFYASLVSYSLMFALAAGSVRTALLILGGALGFFVVGQAIAAFASMVFGVPDIFLFGAFVELLNNWPGPLHVFLGDWLLVDV